MTLLPQKFKILRPHLLSAVVYVDMLISQLYLSTSSTLIRLAERKNRETVSILMLLSKREFRINYDLGLELSKILLTLSHLEGEQSCAISAEVMMSAQFVREARDFSALPMFFCRQFKVLKLNLKGAIYFHRLKFYQIFDSESQPLSLRVSLLKVPLLKQQQMQLSVKDIIKFCI